MEKNCFELLLAMMRLLEREERLGSSLEKAAVQILDFFDAQLTDEQKREIGRDFARYEAQMKKRRLQRELEEKIKEREYDEGVRLFEAEKIDFD